MSPDGIFFCFALTWLQLTFGSPVGKLYNRHGVGECSIEYDSKGGVAGKGEFADLLQFGMVEKVEKDPIEISSTVHTILHE
jgi:hypothetical protein